MNDLERYFYQNRNRQINKWEHYFEIYEKHFDRFRNKEIYLVEIGVYKGGSLQMWKNYFGEKARIYGIDINPECKKFEEKNIEIIIGSQSDRNFLKKFKNQIPKIDILIDDGGHMMSQQIITYEELFDHISDDGIYLCEDLHTSYWLKFGGGYKRRGTFIEYSKNFIDYLHGFHSKQRTFRSIPFTSSVHSIHFYDSILVVEKKNRTKPVRVQSGMPTISGNLNNDQSSMNFKGKLKQKMLYWINVILRFLRIRGFVWN